ncbi:MAG: hypothetical protein EA363_12340 [Balneolaceae bacterium]|nr:MAG: hypothetical protein EA363_12340 [Balneolaceae bacterium]
MGVSHYVDAIRSGKTAELPRELVAHVEACKECKKEVLRLHTVMADIGHDEAATNPKFDKPAKLTGKWQYYAYWTAAAVALFVLLGSLALYLDTSTDEITVADEPRLDQPLPYGPEETEPPLIEDEEPDERKAVDRDANEREAVDRDANEREAVDREPTDREQEEQEAEDRRAEEMLRDMYAANFEPLPLYESMTAQNFRSFGLEIVAPGVGSEIRDGVTFRWEIRYDDPLIVTIIDNQGDRVHQSTVSGNAYYFDDFPAPGLFYWRLETQESLLYVGKFTVAVE